MNKCVICDKECAGLTCSAKCRKAKSRRDTKCDIKGYDALKDMSERVDKSLECDTPKGKAIIDNMLDQLDVIVEPVTVQRYVRTLTRVQLQQAIRAYPHDQWVNSPEHKELMRRLRTLSIEQLQEQGYWIPAWKVAG